MLPSQVKPSQAKPTRGQRLSPELEDVRGSKALDWFNKQAARSLPELEGSPVSQAGERGRESILQDPRRIALLRGGGEFGPRW